MYVFCNTRLSRHKLPDAHHIRKCINSKGYETCSNSCEMEHCDKLSMATSSNKQAPCNLRASH